MRCATLGLVLSASALIALPHTADAQAIVSGAIEGVVRGPDNRPMFGVTITVSNQLTGRRWILRTDRSGRYGLGFLGAGRYDALFERIGYLPERVEGILVEPGDRRDVSLGLVEAEGPVVQVQVRPAAAALSLSGLAGPDRWLTGGPEAATMPLDVSDVTAVTAMSSVAGRRHEIEGLPSVLSTIVIDGVPAAPRLRAIDRRTRATVFPLSSLAFAALETNVADVEYPGSAAGFLTGSVRSGAGPTRLDLHGDFGSDAISVGASDLAAFQTYRVGGTVGGAIVRDTAGFMVGFEYAKLETPYRSLWADDTAAASLQSMGSSFNLDLSDLARPSAESVERASGYARLDLRLGERSTLNIRGSATSLPTTAFYAPWTERTPGTASVETATEVFASTSLLSRLGTGSAHNDLTIGFELSTHDRDVASGDPALIEPPRTFAASSGLGFGSDLARVSESQMWSVYGRNTLHINTQGGHRLKLGLAAQLPRYEMALAYPNAASFVFPNVSAWNGGDGYYVGTDAVLTRHDWTAGRLMFYAQDAWKPTATLQVLAGGRVSVINNGDSLKVRSALGWALLSGLSNRSIEATNIEIEPRFAMVWRPAGTNVVVEGAAQVDAQPIHPMDIAELFFQDATHNIRRGFGRIPSWPVAPDTLVAPVEGPALTMIGPEYRGPRTSRLSGSITFDVAGEFALSAAATYRTTEFLPQRVDVNLLPRTAATDQNGRPIFGTLRKEGTLLFADGDSNRRFPEFDAVWGLQATGVSDYTGITLTAERPLREWFAFRASYTYSKTDDNWLNPYGSDPSTQLSPFPDSLNGADWADGRSDFDVPHRAVVGVEVRMPGQIGATLGALYRYQSGYPFTPGFRAGVDANADGSASNDPAFIDNTIAGISELVSQWSCLSSSVGGFVARNACRGPSIQALDARLALNLGTLEQVNAHVIVDALNLIATEQIVPDRAVYLVDGSRDLIVSPNGRSVNVPLIANPNFGQPMLRYTPERVVRLGLRVSF